MRVIERKASKPHAVYRGGNGASRFITIPKEFSVLMELDKPKSFVVSHLVVAYDNEHEKEIDLTAEEAVKIVAEGRENTSMAFIEGDKGRGRHNNKRQQRLREKKTYIVLEKLET